MANQIQIDLASTSGVVCKKCKCPTFEEVLLVRKVSRFVVGSPEDVYMPVPAISCSNCGTICVEALVPEVRQLFTPGVDEVEVVEDEASSVQKPSNIIQMPKR